MELYVYSSVTNAIVNFQRDVHNTENIITTIQRILYAYDIVRKISFIVLYLLWRIDSRLYIMCNGQLLVYPKISFIMLVGEGKFEKHILYRNYLYIAFEAYAPARNALHTYQYSRND